MKVSDTVLGLMSETPISFDGERYLHSPNEGIYIDGLAQRFKKVIIYTYAFRKGDDDYANTAAYRFTQSNIEIVELPLARPGGLYKLRKVWQLLVAFWVIVARRQEWDVAYTFIPGYNGAFAALAFRVLRRPYFLYLASDWPEEAALLIPFKGALKKPLVPLFRSLVAFLQDASIRGALFTLTAGTDLCERYVARGFANIHETIPRLTWSHYTLYPRQDSCEGPVVTLLFVANLIERKGGTYVLSALKELRQITGINFRCVIVGWGAAEEGMRAQVKADGLESHVEFCGHMAGAGLTEKFRQADIFLFASFSGEGFPRVLYEAMSQGLPIVSTDICGIDRKLGNEKEVLFVPPQDAHAIAQAVLRIVQDQALRKTLIANGMGFMQRMFDNPKGDQQVATLYERIAR